MGEYDRPIANALRMIQRKGAACVWRKVIPPINDDPANPGAGTNQDFPVRIVFFPNNQIRLASSLSMIAKTEVPSGRVMGYMGAVSFVPQMVDRVIGTPYGDLGLIDTNGIDELAPNGQTILYTLRFAR